jgi:hypothetical protein
LKHVNASKLGELTLVVARVVALGVAALLAAALPGAARADEPSFNGPWSMTSIGESYVVQQWAPACGPAPVSGTMRPATSVTVRSDQGELVIADGSSGVGLATGQLTGERRTFRTDDCLDSMPTLKRDAHTREARAWRTRCVTPPSDPRHAVINTVFFVLPGDDTITVAETGRYELTIESERCIADVKRSASLARLHLVNVPGSRNGGSASIDRLATSAGAKAECSTVGEPARLEVRPSRKLLRLGESFTFHGAVLDGAGCVTGTAIQWSVGPVAFRDGSPHGARPTIDGGGKLTVPESDFADATFDVVASASGRSARASVEATSATNYEALLAQSGLDSKGERDVPAVAVIATSSLGASGAHAEDGATRRRITFVAIVGGLAALLGVVAVVGARRARRALKAEKAAEQRHAQKMRDYERQKQEREKQHADMMRAHIQSVAIAQQQAAAAAARGIATGPSFCPSCRREFPGGSAFCPFDSNRLVAIAGHEDLLAGPAGGVCPACRKGFNPGVRVCPNDGEDLVPPVVAEAHPLATTVAQVRGKICPTCGDRFEGAAAFCGKDGTQLVLVN